MAQPLLDLVVIEPVGVGGIVGFLIEPIAHHWTLTPSTRSTILLRQPPGLGKEQAVTERKIVTGDS
jgi:hypothetical protein